MLDSIFHMTLKFLKSSNFGVKLDFALFLCKVKMDVVTKIYLNCKPLVVYLLNFIAGRYITPRRNYLWYYLYHDSKQK